MHALRKKCPRMWGSLVLESKGEEEEGGGAKSSGVLIPKQMV